MRRLIFFVFIVFAFNALSQQNELNGLDGPYIIGDSVFYVNESDQLLRQKVDRLSAQPVRVNNADLDEFSVQLKRKYKPEKDTYKSPDKILVIADIEGNFNAFQSFLCTNGIMDEGYNWIFGEGHLVLNGDFVDRGRNVTQVLWLIYHLEQEAEKHGGKVHFILGNHEVMNMHGDIRYVDEKYKAAALQISRIESEQGAFIYLFSAESELGKWMRSKNIMERIGPYIFVHAGLSERLLEMHFSMKEINQKFRFNIDNILYSEKVTDPKVDFLFSGLSPIWYRGLAMQMKQYEQATQEEVDQILRYFKGQKVIIGHTVVPDICTAYKGKVIKVDVKHGIVKNSPKTKGLLIENGIIFKVDDIGKRVHL